MQTILRNFVISLSIILSGLTINSMLIKLATLCTLINNSSGDTDKYADQQHVFEQVGL